MAGGRFSPVLVGQWMDQVESMSIWIGLCFSDPFAVANPLTVEIQSGGYARVPTGWSRTSSNILTMSSEAVIRGLAPGDVVAAVTGWDSAYNGSMVFSDLLPTPLSYPSGGTYLLPASEYVIGIDVAGA